MVGKRTNEAKYGKYTQKPLEVGVFEEILSILDEIGIDALVMVAMKIDSLLQGNRGSKVTVDVSEAVEAAMVIAAKIGKTKALVRIVAALLEISAEDAARVPMEIVRQVVTDFFTLNAAWLPNMRSSLAAARKVQA